MLDQIEYHKLRHRTADTHQVWQKGSRPPPIQGDEMLLQKIAYIHKNPVRRGWVDLPEHWRYSSARNYLVDDQSVLVSDLLG